MRFICCIILILSFQIGSSQSKKKKSIYYIKVSHIDGTVSKGIFQGLSDSTIIVARLKGKDTVFQTIRITDTEKFFTRRKGAIGVSFGIGVLTGCIIGLLSYDEPEPEDGWNFTTQAGDVILGGVIGGVAGIVIGNGVKKYWKINGSKEQFDRLRPQLIKYCYTCN